MNIMITIEFTEQEVSKLKKLIEDFQSFYEDEDPWDFDDVDAQREIALDIVGILQGKL